MPNEGLEPTLTWRAAVGLARSFAPPTALLAELMPGAVPAQLGRPRRLAPAPHPITWSDGSGETFSKSRFSSRQISLGGMS